MLGRFARWIIRWVVQNSVSDWLWNQFGLSTFFGKAAATIVSLGAAVMAAISALANGLPLYLVLLAAAVVFTAFACLCGAAGWAYHKLIPASSSPARNGHGGFTGLVKQIRLFHKQLQPTAVPKTDPFPTWYELEARFKELEPAMQFSRVDGSFGSAGEFWRIAGAPIGENERRFEAVCAMASARLFQDFTNEVNLHPELAREKDPTIRWYKALRYMGGAYEQDVVAYEKKDDGTLAGPIYAGTIHKPAAASTTLCLQLASRLVQA